MAASLKIVVLDDDPTGSQTVHGCPLLLRWDHQTLQQGLAHPSPLLFLLANTRALDPAAAAERVREICRALKPALLEAREQGALERWLLVSRGDSTLRGHFPLECDVIAAELAEVVDATLLVPAFLPGGRTTRAGVHRLHGEPVHTTPFASDRLFSYSTSYLPDWIEQKSGGLRSAAAVQHIGLEELDGAAAAGAGFDRLCDRLAALQHNTDVTVDAERESQLASLGAAVRLVTDPSAAARWGRPRHFLVQSAASLLNGLVEIDEQPLDIQGLVALRRRDAAGCLLPGLVQVGSHVPLADAQLQPLLQAPGCQGVELDVAKVARVLEGPVPAPLLASLERHWRQQLQEVLAADCTPVLFTSRGELACRHAAERRRLGWELALLMARLVAGLAPQLGYVVSKGGITTHTLLAEGLALDVVELQGQLLPGLSLVLTPPTGMVPSLPVVTFPGNLGDATTLHQCWALFEAAGG